ncbi:beta/gamma crystallin domain-containing protein [Streptomyces sp. NPDC056785]|uniref:beta/gamma crystallin domain-containing protein n=1 Tax=Streptomyces sp. NPDC056785 TaxID=3345944 RepID=UPI0036947937
MQKKKLISPVALVGAAAAALTVLGPVSSASAMSNVPCTPGQGYLKIWDHPSGFPAGTTVECYAVAGYINWNRVHGQAAWIDRIQTGNNDVVINDCNGAQDRFDRWTDTIFPNRPINACQINIL